MRIALLILGGILWGTTLSLAQPETEEAEESEYVFKVKRFVIGKQPDTTNTLASPVVVDTLNRENNADSSCVMPEVESVVKLPKIIRGTISFMDIRPYDESIDLKGKKYVVFQHDINKYGWAQNVQVFASNDRRLVRVVLRKLQETQWSPALNANGNAINYTTSKLIILVNQRTYEVDYYDNY